MADIPVQPPQPNTFTLVAGSTNIQNMRTAAMQKTMNLATAMTLSTALTEMPFDLDSVASLILTDVNGRSDLPEQKVQVEYLTNSQRLYIPMAMGMSLAGFDAGRCEQQPALVERYWHLSGITYAQLKTIASSSTSYAAIRNQIMDRPSVVGNAARTDWLNDAWCILENGQQDTPDGITLTFGIISYALQSNCDIRDYTRLNDADMTVADNAWQTYSTVLKSRLSVKLKPYTLQCIAAMNYVPCANNAMAAWTRAYGLAAGVLWSVGSATKDETAFTAEMPATTARQSVSQYEQQASFDMFPMAMNILAMFGLFHLNKDHTYKTNDANMERIATSYINTLRTMTNQAAIDSFQNNKEPIVRTGPHPFGLAQTYFVALVMGNYGCLASPLSIRTDTTPPPIQRLMIIQAARGEWSNLPAGQLLNTVYEKQLGTVQQAIAMIKSSPPSYSGLHTLYGIPTQSVVSNEVLEDVTVLMPCVYGYAMSQHVSEQSQKDGIALALSLNNVARDQKSLVNTWNQLWDKYFDTVDAGGLLEFARQALAPVNIGAQAPVGVMV